MCVYLFPSSITSLSHSSFAKKLVAAIVISSHMEENNQCIV